MLSDSVLKWRVLLLTGGHEDGDKVQDDVHVSDAGRSTSSRPTTTITATPGHTRHWGPAGTVDHGTREESGSTETETALVSSQRHWSHWQRGLPGCVHWTNVTFTTTDALLPGR